MHPPDGRPTPAGEPERPPRCGETIWAIGPAIGLADIQGLCERLAALLRDSRATVVICDVRAITEPDLATIEALARLQLTARRLGCGIRICRAHRRLRDLIGFTGLGEVLPLCAGPGAEPS